MKVGIMLFIFTILCPFQGYSIGYDIDNIYGDFSLSSGNKMVTMDLEGVSLINVLKILSKQTGLNFVSTEAVQSRELTFYLDNVPFKAAMDIIFDANGLTYDYFPEVKVFVIKEIGKPSVELKTKIYKLQHLLLNSTNIQKALSGLVEFEEVGDSGEFEVGRGITDIVAGLLTERGVIAEDPISNSLVVTDVPTQFAVIDEVIATLDVPRIKVMIEVEVLDVTKNATDNLGVDWGSAEVVGIDVTGIRGTSFPFDSKGADTRGTEWDELTSLGYDLEGWSFNHYTPSVLRIVNASLALQLLRTHRDTKSLARPKLMTLSNETATVNLKRDEAVGLRRTGSGKDEDIQYELVRAETGVRLTVTPRVNTITKEITLVTEVSTKEVIVSDLTFSIFDDQPIRDPEERFTRSVVRLKNGETLLIGGLLKEDKVTVETNVAGFSRIPFLGALFRHKSVSNEQRELLIFITPRLIEEDDTKYFSQPIRTREQTFTSRTKNMSNTLDRFSR